MRRLSYIALLSLGVGMAWGEQAVRTVTAEELRAGKVAPLTAKLSELNGLWTQVELALPASAEEMEDFKSGIAPPKLLTRCELVSLGGQTYLLAYRLPMPDDERYEAPPLGPGPLTGETEVRLTLIRYDAILAWTHLAPFDPAAITRDGPRRLAEYRQKQALQRLDHLRQSIGQHTSYIGWLPPTDTVAVFTHRHGYWSGYPHDQLTDPVSGQPFALNRRLHLRKLAHLSDLSHLVVAFQPQPTTLGVRAVLFLDGTVRDVPEADWPAIKRRSRVPEPDERVPPPPELPPAPPPGPPPFYGPPVFPPPPPPGPRY